jgi:hypothetical protein
MSIVLPFRDDRYMTSREAGEKPASRAAIGAARRGDAYFE